MLLLLEVGVKSRTRKKDDSSRDVWEGVISDVEIDWGELMS